MIIEISIHAREGAIYMSIASYSYMLKMQNIVSYAAWVNFPGSELNL